MKQYQFKPHDGLPGWALGPEWRGWKSTESEARPGVVRVFKDKSNYAITATIEEHTEHLWMLTLEREHPCYERLVEIILSSPWKLLAGVNILADERWEQ